MIKYEKFNAEETHVYDENCVVLGSIKRETPPAGVPYAWVYRYWPVHGERTSAFPSLDQLKKKIEAR